MIPETAAFLPLLPDFGAGAVSLDLRELPGDASEWVKHDSAGVPVAFRLFPMGPFSVTKEGKTFNGEFTADHARQIVEYFAGKGSRVPVDSQHVLKALADSMATEEDELAAVLGGRFATMAFGDLESKADGLWLSGIDWVPIGRKLMLQKILRYFSPVLRGLQEGPLRLTSVAMTNTPAMNGLRELVADAEHDPERVVFERGSQGLLLAGVRDAVGLAAESGPESVLAAVKAIAGRVREAEGQLAAIQASTVAVRRQEVIRAGLADGRLCRADVDTWAGQAEEATLGAYMAKAQPRVRNETIERGMREGKLTPYLAKGWASRIDVAVLSDYLDGAPVIIPMGRVVVPGDGDEGQAPDRVQESVARVCGVDGRELAARMAKQI